LVLAPRRGRLHAVSAIAARTESDLLWGYDGADDRAARRERLAKDPDWQK
jgi:hypothetical protein